ncbi:FAD-dependent monooxygenase [Polaribacter sp. MSW13]|uniref:FAD-dependent monooxygenase n=1 Tax=Polaribacter marinus TaxID=2916838 RepID=A0A9X1VNY8_9FLAO|nr:FAD-dependent monooxygenase [Polaribacter marinus]MCI2230064.1 FAD-dependent monooxygenase [Polaribacter marinus]
MMYTIIGAGIGGLSTALAFEAKGIPYQIFEKAPALNEVGAGIWLAPNALQVLEDLQVLEEVKEKGNAIDRITIGKPDLSPLSDIQQDIFKDKYGFTTISIHRAALQKLLFDKIPKDKIFLNKGFQSFKELKSGKIEITFNDTSKTETNFLIGADGINSKVRNQLFPDSRRRYSGQTCWRGVVDLKLDEKYAHRGFELWGNQIRFGISEVAKDKVYWFAVILSAENSEDDKRFVKEKLQSLFFDFHPLVLKLISETPVHQILKNDINDLKPLPNWYKGNICLIGDAGHATTPNMGQGGAQAIEDAYYLSNLINENTGKNVFKLFQEQRHKKVKTVVNQSWSTGKMAHWKYGKRMRNFILKNMPKKIIEKKMFEMYHIDKFQN